MSRERAVDFSCGADVLHGVLHQGDDEARQGVLVVVGGPQYRAGSHRQFVLLARFLAEAGIPVFRFDYRGMGDSAGEPRTFEDIDEDIRAAIDTFFSLRPAMRSVVIWGLCDAASAALFYAYRDDRVKGLVLLNPWVRTEEGEAKAYFRHYYLKRLFAPEPWRKLVRGEFDFSASFRSLAGFATRAFRRQSGAAPGADTGEGMLTGDLPQRMRQGLSRFPGRVLLILSGNDLTAAEFEDRAASDPEWRALLEAERVERRKLEEADHTFSRRVWSRQVEEWTLQWLRRGQ